MPEEKTKARRDSSDGRRTFGIGEQLRAKYPGREFNRLMDDLARTTRKPRRKRAAQ